MTKPNKPVSLHWTNLGRTTSGTERDTHRHTIPEPQWPTNTTLKMLDIVITIIFIMAHAALTTNTTDTKRKDAICIYDPKCTYVLHLLRLIHSHIQTHTRTSVQLFSVRPESCNVVFPVLWLFSPIPPSQCDNFPPINAWNEWNLMTFLTIFSGKLHTTRTKRFYHFLSVFPAM